jgi:hypothetical protein
MSLDVSDVAFHKGDLPIAGATSSIRRMTYLMSRCINGINGMNRMALLEHGFLGAEGDKTRQGILKKYADFFGLLKELNDVCHEYLRKLKLNRGDELEVFTVAYFIRGLITFQSLVVLLERGCLDDVRALCRTLLHAYFRLAALAADPTVLNRIRATSISEQKKRLESFKSGKLKIPPGSGNIDFDAKIAEAEAQFQKLGGSKVNEKELATIGGRLGDYNTGYAVMSDAVHTSLSDLLSSLKFGHKGNFLGYIYGPNDKDLAVFAGYALALLGQLDQHKQGDQTRVARQLRGSSKAPSAVSHRTCPVFSTRKAKQGVGVGQRYPSRRLPEAGGLEDQKEGKSRILRSFVRRLACEM